jgi:hypothetical protein
MNDDGRRLRSIAWWLVWRDLYDAPLRTWCRLFHRRDHEVQEDWIRLVTCRHCGQSWGRRVDITWGERCAERVRGLVGWKGGSR